MMATRWVSYRKILLAVTMRIVSLTFIAFLPVFTWAASAASGQGQLSFSGITEPIKDVTLSVSVEGTISTIFFKEGAQIGKMQTILELDNMLEKLEVERRKLLWESKAEVESATAKVATLKSMLESTRELFKRTGAVSKEDLDKMALEYALAVAEKKRFEIAEERERIEYEIALQNLSKRRLKSPIQGIIIKLLLKEGENCEPNQPLVRVVDISKCLFVCNVEERIGRTLMKGQQIDLDIRTGSESVAKEGAIVFVSPVVDAASGLLEVKVEFQNPNGTVRPGVEGFMLLTPP